VLSFACPLTLSADYYFALCTFNFELLSNPALLRLSLRAQRGNLTCHSRAGGNPGFLNCSIGVFVIPSEAKNLSLSSIHQSSFINYQSKDTASLNNPVRES
jgi:hypothetical protein